MEVRGVYLTGIFTTGKKKADFLIGNDKGLQFWVYKGSGKKAGREMLLTEYKIQSPVLTLFCRVRGEPSAEVKEGQVEFKKNSTPSLQSVEAFLLKLFSSDSRTSANPSAQSGQFGQPGQPGMPGRDASLAPPGASAPPAPPAPPGFSPKQSSKSGLPHPRPPSITPGLINDLLAKTKVVSTWEGFGGLSNLAADHAVLNVPLPRNALFRYDATRSSEFLQRIQDLSSLVEGPSGGVPDLLSLVRRRAKEQDAEAKLVDQRSAEHDKRMTQLREVAAQLTAQLDACSCPTTPLTRVSSTGATSRTATVGDAFPSVQSGLDMRDSRERLVSVDSHVGLRPDPLMPVMVMPPSRPSQPSQQLQSVQSMTIAKRDQHSRGVEDHAPQEDSDSRRPKEVYEDSEDGGNGFYGDSSSELSDDPAWHAFNATCGGN